MWQYCGQQRPAFALQPGPGQESVWDYPRPPRLAEDARRILVRDGGRVLADSRRAIRVLETASPPTFYLPPTDIELDRLIVMPGSSLCEWKGPARYWALGARPEAAVGWDYPQPAAAFQAITGYLAFYPQRLDCYVDDERVRAQDGGFYGGWVTREIIGPFKGAPGTGHW